MNNSLFFSTGNTKERSTLLGSLERLKEHLGLMNVFRFNVDFLDNLFARFVALSVNKLSRLINYFLNLSIDILQPWSAILDLLYLSSATGSYINDDVTSSS